MVLFITETISTTAGQLFDSQDCKKTLSSFEIEQFDGLALLNITLHDLTKFCPPSRKPSI